MDFKKLITRFRQFGGFRLVWQYAKLGALWPAIKAGVRCLVKGQSFKGIYPEVLKKVEPFLVERCDPFIKDCIVCRNLKKDKGHYYNNKLMEYGRI